MTRDLLLWTALPPKEVNQKIWQGTEIKLSSERTRQEYSTHAQLQGGIWGFVVCMYMRFLVLVFCCFFLLLKAEGRCFDSLCFKQSAIVDPIFPSQTDFKPSLANSINPAYQGSRFLFLSSVRHSLTHGHMAYHTLRYSGISQHPQCNISTTIISEDDT